MWFCTGAFYVGYNLVWTPQDSGVRQHIAVAYFSEDEQQMEPGPLHQLISLADSTATLPPYPVVAHITGVVQSRPLREAAAQKASWRPKALGEITARLLGKRQNWTAYLSVKGLCGGHSRN